MKTNIIGIYAMSVSTEMLHFANTGIYRTVPIILYKVNNEKVKHFYIDRPVEIFRESMEYSSLKNIVNIGEQDVSFLTIPGKAYSKMQQYANKNVNKVIADMVTHVIVEVVNELKTQDADSQNVFFIDGIDTNKIIGRLGYLYLESNFNTIAFVTYKTGGLLTDILNSSNEKLEFDINYFKRKNKMEEYWSTIVPNDFMESLTQTVFYHIPSTDAELSPIRCDILSQGLSKGQIKQKVKKIYEILSNPENVTLPFPEKGDGGMWIRIPVVLKECMEAAEHFKAVAENVLQEGFYE